jgi:hypothetical protein
MLSTKDLLKSNIGKKLPDKIKKHSALKSISHINKVFPYIGLDNSSELLSKFKHIKLEEFKKAHIYFSSVEKNGIWDIATMSMRGIHSCMKWSSKQSKHLIGSIIDPFTAVIYITDKTKLKYGSKFLRRSVVRYMVYNTGKNVYKPFIFIERVYAHSKIRKSPYVNKDTNETDTANIFTDYIKSKLNIDIPIYYGSPPPGSAMIRPSFVIKDDELSYSDAHLASISLSDAEWKSILPPKFLQVQF